MGIAAYNRGSRGISRDIRERYTELHPDYKNFDREYVPTPRPAGWGDKAKARAEAYARRILASNRRYGLSTDLELLTAVIVDRTGAGEQTARAAAAAALAEPMVSPQVAAVLRHLDRAVFKLGEPLRTQMQGRMQRRRGGLVAMIERRLAGS